MSRAWIHRDGQQLRPSVFVNNLQTRMIMLVDVTTNRVISMRPLVLDAIEPQGLVFDDIFIDRGQALDEQTEVKPFTNLPNVLLNDDSPQPLYGDYVAPSQCCRYYVCSTQDCAWQDALCAQPTDPGAIRASNVYSINMAWWLGDAYNYNELGYPAGRMYVEIPSCVMLPNAYSSSDGWIFDEPDESSPNKSEEPFSSVNVYHMMNTYFDWARQNLFSADWCLDEESMMCNIDGSPKIDPTTNLPIRPFHVTVNMFSSRIDADGLVNAIQQGIGRTENNPYLLDYLPYTNAFFTSARSNADQRQLFFNAQPFAQLGFGQSDIDVAYDLSVVVHELQHAVTSSIGPDQYQSIAFDSSGLNAWPGALNECWSDFFAGVYQDDPRIGQYFGINLDGAPYLRTMLNENVCGTNSIGQVHADSQVFSGALWTIYTGIDDLSAVSDKPATKNLFARLVLTSIVDASETETFLQSANRIVDLIDSNGQLTLAAKDQMVKLARDTFVARGVFEDSSGQTTKCTRRYIEFSEDDNQFIYLYSPFFVGLSGYAPAPRQVRIPDVPTWAKAVRIQWTQRSLLSLIVDTGPSIIPIQLGIAVAEDCGPVEFSYEISEDTDGLFASATCNQGTKPVPFYDTTVQKASSNIDIAAEYVYAFENENRSNTIALYLSYLYPPQDEFPINQNFVFNVRWEFLSEIPTVTTTTQPNTDTNQPQDSAASTFVQHCYLLM
eukprot:CAMPEP_0201561368 /NCGR_PEP_ID=MMETSP0173_2-20130828/78761_1 /ASSEMBLY_ACC=CAM_ASM_000268 /TAXON_ID=218659 /ORGANISM="Vexillifera sp., Strain DIVA3 564/2" /LENGTH=719 /DNA_ID=CAMNT_0047975869 /DNA_START=561 /DNA_END=2717 /DNA_ORIENTATION=+